MGKRGRGRGEGGPTSLEDKYFMERYHGVWKCDLR